MNISRVICHLIAGFGLTLSSCREGSAPSAPLTFDEAMEVSRHSERGNDHLRQLLDFVGGLNAAEVEAGIDRLVENNPLGRHYELLPMLYHRWCELDFEAALDHALKQESDQQYGTVSAVVSWWAARDPDAAWNWFEKEGADFFRTSPGQTILRAIAREDPKKALSLHRDSKAIRHSTISDSPAFIYGTWALDDPVSAASHLDEAESDASIRRTANNMILNVWVLEDPEAAWQWILQRPRTRERLAAARIFFSRLAGKDLEEAEQFLARIEPGFEKDEAIEGIVGGLAIFDPSQTYDFVKRHTDGEVMDRSLLSMVFSSWASRDPDRAFEVAKSELAAGRDRDAILGNIIQTVGRQNVDQATAMLEEIGYVGELGFAVGSVAGVKAENDIEAALEWAGSLPKGHLRDQAMTQVFSEWVAEAPEEAAAKALQVAGEEPGSSLPRDILNRWSSRDPSAAVAWAAENIEEADKAGVIPSLIGQWAEKDLMAASNWVGELPAEAESLKGASLGQIANVWANRDLEKAGAWLESLKAGKPRDQAMSRFSNQVFHRDPELGMSWALKIEDERQRTGTFEYMARRYLSDQKEKARQWIEENPDVSDELKAQLLRE